MREVILNWYSIEMTWKEDGDARDEKHWVYAKYCAWRQVHWVTIHEVEWDDTGNLDVYCDGLFWSKDESYLGVYTGDCCPIALLGKRYFVVVHWSWKTLYKWIVWRAFELLELRKENLAEVMVYFWPSNREESYEVGREFYNYFPKRFLQKFDWKLTFDMVQFAISQMEFAGISKENIHVDPYCTFQNNDMYYSHRRWDPSWNFFGVSKAK